MTPFQWGTLLVAAFLAGGVNAVAGGGTLLVFPTLLSAGFTSTSANATTTVSLVSGPIGSLYGLRDRLGKSALFAPMLAVGTIGGALGAYLLTITPDRLFDRVVPFLILLATVLFLVQEPLSKRLGTVHGDGPERMRIGVAAMLLGVAVYGGYFGAGIGILTLAALGLLGLTDIHRMNAVKSVFTFGTNLVAATWLLVAGKVNLPVAGALAVAAIVGGYAGGKLGPRIGARNVRRIVIVIGFGLTLYQLYKAFL